MRVFKITLCLDSVNYCYQFTSFSKDPLEIVSNLFMESSEANL